MLTKKIYNSIKTTESHSGITIGNLRYLFLFVAMFICLPNGKAQISVCSSELLTVSASNNFSSSPYVLEYVLVCGGTVFGPNATGIFDLEALGITGPSSCTVYAVNHDGTETFASWPTPISTCFTSVDTTVNITAGPDLIVSSPILNSCPTTTADLTSAVIDADGGSLSYYSDAGLMTTVPTPTSVGAGTYYVVSTFSGCQDVESVDVFINNCLTDTTICDTEILSVSATNAFTNSGYVLEYVLVCGGTVYGPNSTGNFDLPNLGITGPSNCTVYAVNHDGTETFTTWPTLTSSCLTSVDRDVIVIAGPDLMVDATISNTCPSITANLNDAVLDADGGSLTFFTDAGLTSSVPNPTMVGAGTYYIVSTSGSCSDDEQVIVSISNCLADTIVCESTILSLTVSDANLTGNNELEYVFVCGGSVISINTTGNFDLAALGISAPSSCTVYAVNHDGSADLSSWPPAGTSCIEFIDRGVNVISSPDLQVDATISNICPATTANLNDAILDADGGLLTFFTSAALTTSVSNPAAVGAGTYYIVSSIGSCQDDEMVTVTINVCLPDTNICEGSILTVSANGANLTGVYELDYVFVCGGSVISNNNTGVFDLDALGVSASSSCTVYAVNHDGNADFSSWPPTGTTCIEYIERDVTVLANGTSAFTDTICGNAMYTLPSGTNVIGPGIYSDTIPGTFCDSILSITLVSPPSSVFYGLYAASGSDYHQVNPLTGVIQNTYNASVNSLGWVNGAFTIHQQAATIYWVSDVFELNSMDLTTGIQTSTATDISTLSYFWGLRFYNGHLYTITTSGDNDKVLVRVDPGTGDLDAGFPGIEINGSANNNILINASPVINPQTGVLYLPLYENALLAFDINNNSGSLINLTGYGTPNAVIGLLEINEDTGEMYAMSGFSDIVNIAMTGATTANVSLVKALTTGSGFSNPVSAFDSDNDIYVFQAAEGCAASSPLIAVDVNTGEEWCSDPIGDAFTQLEFLNCRPASTLRESEENDIELYPNPVKEKLTIDLEQQFKGAITINVVSLSGILEFKKSYLVEKGTNQIEIDLANLNNGLYIVQVMGNGQNLSKKIVKF